MGYTQTRRSFLQTLGATSPFFWADDAWKNLLTTDTKTDVIILGAGLSGLYSAMMLEEKGYSVKILEAQNRIGGRLFTLDDLPGKPNGGGVEVGDAYNRLIAIANKLNVKLESPNPEARTAGLLSINGNLIKESDWAGSKFNFLNEKEKNTQPSLLEYSYLKDNNPLQTLDDWYNPQYAAFDIPFSEFLKQKGASDEAIRLINANSNTNDVHTTSTLNYFKSLTFRLKSGSKKTLRIAGGSQRLPEAMAKSLKTTVQQGMVVKKMEQSAKGVKVTCQDGSKHEATLCICTLPFTALRNVQITPAITGTQAEAIKQLPYTAITQVHLGVKGNFWEDDNLPLNTWTDSLIGRFFSDKGTNGITNYLCWINGIEAQTLDKMGAKTTSDLVIKELARLRPATTGKLEVLKVNSWGNNPFAGGAYCHFGPNQVTKFVKEISKPNGKIFFAGEHTSKQNNGMESALESAERVISEVLALK